MTHRELPFLLFVALGVAGCPNRSASDREGPPPGQGRENASRAEHAVAGIGRPTRGATLPSERPSGAASQAYRFFPNPVDADLAAALERSDWAGAERAVHAGANVNAVGKDGMYPLVWAMYVRNTAAFAWLLEHGADPNSDSGGDHGCALFWAAEAEQPDWLRLLLSHGANPNLTRKAKLGLSETALLAAVNLCHSENVKMLIAAGAEVNYRSPPQVGGGTPAIYAAGLGWFEGVCILLEAGADYRPRTRGGFDVVQTIADRHVRPGDGNYESRNEALRMLRERGADVDSALEAARRRAKR